MALSIPPCPDHKYSSLALVVELLESLVVPGEAPIDLLEDVIRCLSDEIKDNNGKVMMLTGQPSFLYRNCCKAARELKLPFFSEQDIAKPPLSLKVARNFQVWCHRRWALWEEITTKRVYKLLNINVYNSIFSTVSLMAPNILHFLKVNEPTTAIQSELRDTESVLKKDPRCYNAWKHYSVLSLLASRECHSFVMKELHQHPLNASAWAFISGLKIHKSLPSGSSDWPGSDSDINCSTNFSDDDPEECGKTVSLVPNCRKKRGKSKELHLLLETLEQDPFNTAALYALKYGSIIQSKKLMLELNENVEKDRNNRPE